jgi:asparagine synthase (glutamine-hydrolysing)
MFALAAWDVSRKRLLLARDPFGIKPLFYMLFDDCLWFASEIKALLEVPGFAVRQDREALHHYFSFDFIPDELTPFEGIRELRPGHALEMTPGDAEPRIWRFCQLEYDVDRGMSLADAVDATRTVLTESVERQLVADVPVGVMLSGGMDSSSLAALMAQVRGNPEFHTFSLAFDDPTFDESPWARAMADQLGTIHHEIRVTPRKAMEMLPDYLAFIDEPYADGSAIPTLLLAMTAREHVKVLLSGEGGDEVFAGYDTHAAWKARRVYRKLIPGWLRRGLVRPLVNLLPVSRRKLSFEFRAKRFARGAELDVPESHYTWREVLNEDEKRSILRLQSESGDPYRTSSSFFRRAFEECGARDELNRLLYVDCSFHLPDDLMIKNDRMTMACSIEARVPFTDLELFRLLATIPAEHKLRGLIKKNVLKRAMKGVLPRKILAKKKVGLEMPYSRWLRSEMREFAEEVLSQESTRNTEVLDPAGVTRLWSDHQSGASDNGRALWGLVNYVLWHRTYVQSGSTAASRRLVAGVRGEGFRSERG